MEESILGIKWFQLPFDHRCKGSNCDSLYQIQRQLPLNQLAIGVNPVILFVIMLWKKGD
jgi:hypothetical protein